MAGEMSESDRMDALGHADSETTAIYTHETEVGRDREAAFWEDKLFRFVDVG